MRPYRRRGRTGLMPVAEIAGRLPASAGPVGLAVARAAWRLVAGRELAGRLPLVEVAGDTWRLALPAPAWQAELPRLEKELLPRLQALPAGAGVRRLAAAAVVAPPPAPPPIPARDRNAAAQDTPGSARQRLAALARQLLDRGAAGKGR